MLASAVRAATPSGRPSTDSAKKPYRLISKKGEGTFSEVLKAQCVKTGQFHAIKCMKSRFSSIEKVNSLREIQALRRLYPHPHIIQLTEVLYDMPTQRLALVFELMDCNLYDIIKQRRTPLDLERVKRYMYQLLLSVSHMHSNGVFHRDIKPENVLLSGGTLKLADFGSCRGIYSQQPFTEYISTRWYRAPECLITEGYYNSMMDVWGIGCVFYEIVALQPLFPGENERDQLQRIHRVLGSPSKSFFRSCRGLNRRLALRFPQMTGIGLENAPALKDAPPLMVDLMKKLLEYDPKKRISAENALSHPWFADLRAHESAKAVISGNPTLVPPADPTQTVAEAERRHKERATRRRARDAEKEKGRQRAAAAAAAAAVVGSKSVNEQSSVLSDGSVAPSDSQSRPSVKPHGAKHRARPGDPYRHTARVTAGSESSVGKLRRIKRRGLGKKQRKSESDTKEKGGEKEKENAGARHDGTNAELRPVPEKPVVKADDATGAGPRGPVNEEKSEEGGGTLHGSHLGGVTHSVSLSDGGTVARDRSGSPGDVVEEEHIPAAHGMGDDSKHAQPAAQPAAELPPPHPGPSPLLQRGHANEQEQRHSQRENVASSTSPSSSLSGSLNTLATSNGTVPHLISQRPHQYQPKQQQHSPAMEVLQRGSQLANSRSPLEGTHRAHGRRIFRDRHARRLQGASPSLVQPLDRTPVGLARLHREHAPSPAREHSRRRHGGESPSNHDAYHRTQGSGGRIRLTHHGVHHKESPAHPAPQYPERRGIPDGYNALGHPIGVPAHRKRVSGPRSGLHLLPSQVLPDSSMGSSTQSTRSAQAWWLSNAHPHRIARQPRRRRLEPEHSLSPVRQSRDRGPKRLGWGHGGGPGRLGASISGIGGTVHPTSTVASRNLAVHGGDANAAARGGILRYGMEDSRSPYSYHMPRARHHTRRSRK